MRRFLYLRDPLFLVCTVAYGVNQLLLKPHLRSAFLHRHFNDLFVIPCALPPILFLHRLLKIRATDEVPSVTEVAVHLIIWSVVMEIMGPHFVKRATGDAWDILAYTVGAIVALAWWHRATVARFLGKAENVP